MSIAVSVFIRPSPTLRVGQAALCLAVLACGAWLLPNVAGVLLLAGGVAGGVCGRGLVKPARIDISTVGQIRLTVYQQKDAQHAGVGQGVRLMPGSTLWSGLLLLRLQGEGGGAGRQGRGYWLAVLPDSAAPDVRRRLALAVRAIAAGRAGSTGGTTKNRATP
jgi:toxin CptA